MVEEIITDYEKLSVRAKEFGISSHREELQQIITALKDTITEHNLTHLTAPQLGYDARIFCINFNGDIRTFINSMIINVDGEAVLSREHCASLEHDYIIPRHSEIIAMYQTPTGKSESNRFLEPVSLAFEQCQDLIDGVLLSDYGLEITEDFDNATDEEKSEVIGYYIEHLKELSKKLDEEIENDEMLKKTRDAINFMDSVVKGETKLEQTEQKPVKINRATRRLISRKLKNNESGKIKGV